MLIALLASCATTTSTPTEPAPPIVVRNDIRGPLWPTNEVMDEMLGSNLSATGPTWRWMHDNLVNICGQERDAGKQSEACRRL